jgi:hypothetical protein
MSNTEMIHPLSILIFSLDEIANHQEVYIQPFPLRYKRFLLPPLLLTIYNPRFQSFLFLVFVDCLPHPHLVEGLFETFSYFAI